MQFNLLSNKQEIFHGDDETEQEKIIKQMFLTGFYLSKSLLLRWNTKLELAVMLNVDLTS